MEQPISFFSKIDAQKQAQFAEKRTQFLRPFLALLTQLRVHPNSVSSIGLLSTVFAAVLLPINVIYSVIALAIHILLDGIDGPLARFQKRTSKVGAIIDIVVDHASLLIMLASVWYYLPQYPRMWIIGYALSYIALILISIALHNKKIPFVVSIRTKYVFYILLYIDLFAETVWLTFLLILATIYMSLHSLYGIYRLKKHA